jgi:3-oxoacyl-[acyl-carrier-protein] synthase III
MKAYINAISYYLPETILDNRQLNVEHPEWSADKISAKTGIYERHIAANDEFASDMAVKAAKALFKEYGILPCDIDFIIFCTQSPDYFLPTTACIIQNRLEIPLIAGAFDFNLGCSGFVYGLSIAKGLVFSNMAKNILLITSETYSKYIHPKDKSNKTIFGDAAAATLVSHKPGLFEIKDFSFGTDGSGAPNLMVKNGGIRFRNEKNIDITDNGNNFVHNDGFLFMNGSEIFNFSNQAVPDLVENVLIKNKLSKEDINYFVFHQANKYMLDYIRRKINIPSDKFIYYIENVGNTVSSTIPIAMKETILKSKLNAEKILLAGFGVGYSWAGCVLDASKNTNSI